jgi:ribonuclease T1
MIGLTSRRSRSSSRFLLLLFSLLLLFLCTACTGFNSSYTSSPTATGSSFLSTPPPSGSEGGLNGLTIPTPLPDEGLPTIPFIDLPPEAQQTIVLIAEEGPFPYRQDGTVFQNREELLPRKTSGYYREYTVITPGSSDRGARRIIVGAEGELYYSGDHYNSFRRVVP